MINSLTSSFEVFLCLFILCQNIKEDLDPSLNPVLNKSVKKMGGSWYLKLGDREVEYNDNFRFYMTTKLGKPHYSP